MLALSASDEMHRRIPLEWEGSVLKMQQCASASWLFEAWPWQRMRMVVGGGQE